MANTNKMNSLFESWRRFNETTSLVEAQLIVEGRIDDARKKYPELSEPRKEYDNESLMDILVAGDPAGNQRYLMWAAKALDKSIKSNIERGHKPFFGISAYMSEDSFAPWGIAQNLVNYIRKFHGLLSYMHPPERDIYKLKSFEDLQGQIRSAEWTKQDKERREREKEREKTQAKEGAMVVADTDDYTIIRPGTVEASCYYGQGTKWCIAGRDNSYFDDYSREGKAFYFVFFGHIGNDSSWKKAALEINAPRYGVAEFENAWDAPDDDHDEIGFAQALVQNLLNVKKYPGAYRAYELLMPGHIHHDHEEEEPDSETLDQFILAVTALNEKQQSDDAEPSRSLEAVAEAVNELAAEQTREIIEYVEDHARENPVDTEEQWTDVLDNYNFYNIDINLEMPSETGYDHPYWSAHTTVDVDEIIEKHGFKWAFEEETIEKYEDEIQDMVADSLLASSINIDEITMEETGPFDYEHTYNVDIDRNSGSPEWFDSWLQEREEDEQGLAHELPLELVSRLKAPWEYKKEGTATGDPKYKSGWRGEALIVHATPERPPTEDPQGHEIPTPSADPYWPKYSEREKQQDLPDVQEIFKRWRTFLK